MFFKGSLNIIYSEKKRNAEIEKIYPFHKLIHNISAFQDNYRLPETI